jgi:hypothetical protein
MHPATYNTGGEPDGLPLVYGEGREPVRVSKQMQDYYDYRDPPEADDPTPEVAAATSRFLAELALSSLPTVVDGYEF